MNPQRQQDFGKNGFCSFSRWFGYPIISICREYLAIKQDTIVVGAKFELENDPLRILGQVEALEKLLAA